MAVFRINKTADYSVISNNHFKEKRMSLKAKGLLSLMLSLPDNWDYSASGLATLSKDGIDSVKKTLGELEKFGYLKRTRATDTQGRFTGYIYDIFEKPMTESPLVENPSTDKPMTENPPQLNTNQSKTKRSNTKKSSTNGFVPPTLEEVQEYCEQRKNDVNAAKFFDYFSASNWIDSKGNPVRNWKQKIITWEGYNKKEVKTDGQDAGDSGKTQYGTVL